MNAEDVLFSMKLLLEESLTQIVRSNHKHKFEAAIYISSADTPLIILFTMRTTDKKDTARTVIGAKNTTAPKGFVTAS